MTSKPIFGNESTATHILDYFIWLDEIEPAMGYFLEPIKSICVVNPQAVEHTIEIFSHLGFKVVAGTRYLGGHISEGGTAAAWVVGKVETWEAAVIGMSRFA